MVTRGFTFRRKLTFDCFRFGKNADTRIAKTNVSEPNRDRNENQNADGMCTMCEKFCGVEVAIIGEPCGADIHSVRDYTKVGDKPHPIPFCEYCDGTRDNNAEDWAAPKCHQRHGIRLEDAERQMPWKQIEIGQCSTA